MKYILLLLIAITMVQTTKAQNNDDISGSYSLGSGNPEGGSHLLVFDDGTYTILYFGGMQPGEWKLVEGNVYKFSPANKGVYDLYGRNDKNLTNQTRISFNGFENGETFVYAGVPGDNVYTMKRVFNSDANGFSYPYVHTFKTKGDIISFMHKDYNGNRMVTYENPEGYNDFLAFFNGHDQEHESQAFLATFKDNHIFLDESDSAQRVPFDENDEEIPEIRAMAEQMMIREIFYVNPSYNHFEGDIDEYHVYNKEKEAYIDEEYYEEGEELIITEESYDAMSIIYAFKALRDFNTETMKNILDEVPIFEVR